MNRRRLFILIVFVVLAAATMAVLRSQSSFDERSDREASGRREIKRISPDEVNRQSEPSGAQPVASEARLVPTRGQMLRFTIPETGSHPAIEATIGMAGMWPPAQANAPAGGLIPLPNTEVSTLWGDENNAYEVFAHSFDRAHAFWGDVSTDELSDPGIHDIELGRASPLEVVVTDEKGAPVPDAEVRISRGFVGLVHLTKATGERGRAVFDAIPDGEFQVTVKAKGFARKMSRIVHTVGDDRVALSLVEGTTTIGNGELERLAKEVVADGNRTVVAIPEDESEEGDDGSERVRHPLDLYVVDRSGSPVEGALIQLWHDGRRLFEKTSGGVTPVRVEVATPFEGTLVAFDGQRGEGSQRVTLLEPGGEHEVIVRLDRDLLTLDLPPGRINARGRIEQIFGADLVRDNDAWLADVLSPASAAARAGIERGDRVVFLREVSGGYSALIERGSQRVRVQIVHEN